MASAAEQTDATYTLYGFGNDLDWRRTCFLEPLPPSRSCTYCGRVCATMMMLPCCHIICAGCYTQCTKRSHACAFDAQHFQQHDVAVMVYTSQDLASKHIRCWNAGRGCKISGLSFQILEHYHKHCAHHIISCSRCNQPVSHGEIVTHLASGCNRKPVPLLGVQDTQKRRERQNPADSIQPGAAGHFSITPDQHAGLGNVPSCSTAFALAGHYSATNISPVFPTPRQPVPLCDYRGKQTPAHDIYEPVARYLREEAPSVAHAEFLQNPSSDTHSNDSLAGREIPASMEIEILGRLERLSEPNSSFTQERSIQMRGTSSDSSSTSPDKTLLGSYRYLHTASILGAGTLSTPKLNSGRRAILEAKASMQEDDAHLRTERTVGTQGTGNVSETEECNLTRDEAAPTKESTPSHDKDESGVMSQAAPSVFSKHRTNSASTPTNINGEALPSLVQHYINSVCRFVSKTVDGTDTAKDALCKLMPEDLVFVLKTSEEIRAQMSAEGTALSTTRDEVRKAIKNSFQAAQEQNTESGDDVFSQEYVTQKIDNLIDLAKHVLHQRALVSVPVQWYLHNWSELKARAHSAGEAADYFHDINATFYGYAIVPGLLLENTTGSLRLHFSFYLRRGVYDHFLEWPIKKEMTFSIIHPTDKGKVRFLTVDTKKGQVEGCTRPENDIGKPVSRAKSIKADYFDTNEYVNGDKLLLKFEVK